MSAAVADTHTILWYLSADPRLSGRAREQMEQAAADGDPVFVPTIRIVEATYLTEKGRIDRGLLLELRKSMNEPDPVFEAMPLTAGIAFALSRISRESVPDLPDRVIAATAQALRLPLITRDEKIRASGTDTIW